ncbi:hypothetical protein BJ912DRAFT_973717 [Pholiota molesta]|nr:hypothetical protein BJ912DRAFT_973717 [Pholiota molesta]
MALPPDQDVASIFVGALFYGLYLTTLFHCIRWLVFTDEGWKVRKRISWTMLSTTVALWVLATISRALELRNTMVQVVGESKPPAPPPPSGSIGSTTTLPWMAVVICTNANVSTLLADAVLIYRCYIIYDKSKRVIVFPIFLWIGGLMLTALQAYWQIVQSASILKAWQPINMTVGPGTVLTPFWGSTIVLNGYSTFMIIRRIYLVTEGSKGSTSIHQLRFTMRILIESGFLYLATAIAHLVVWWTPNAYAISVISGINLSVTGIAFNLILIRAAQRRVEEEAKIVGAGPISGIHFRANETKTPVGQFGVNTTTQATDLQRRHEDSNSMNGNASTTASIASAV